LEIHFVDSNIFYYHLLQDKVHGPRATGIIRRIRNGEATTTSVIVLSELTSLFEFRVIQIRRREDLSQTEKEYSAERFKKSISNFHNLITTLVHLEKLGCTWDDALKAFTYRSEYGLGFNDAVNLAVMERNNISNIYSFDKTFDNIPWLKRKDS